MVCELTLAYKEGENDDSFYEVSGEILFEITVKIRYMGKWSKPY